jgi:hypothetical protein
VLKDELLPSDKPLNDTLSADVVRLPATVVVAERCRSESAVECEGVTAIPSVTPPVLAKVTALVMVLLLPVMVVR